MREFFNPCRVFSLNDEGGVVICDYPGSKPSVPAPYDKAEASDPRVFRTPVVEAEAHDELLQLIDEGKVDLSEWISDVIPWRDFQKGFDWIKEKKSNKAVLDFTAS